MLAKGQIATTRPIPVSLGVAVMLVLLGGLLRFATGWPCAAGEPVGATDGIVVFTGTPDRLHAGLDLLRAERGARLLISGVKRGTSKRGLSAAMGRAPEMFECCVDLDEAARDTAGNAVETARWARRHGYTSLRVVTAAYHMPRSLIELRRQLPGTELIAHPVCPGAVKLDRWWAWPGTGRLVFGEYAKYLISLVRARLSGPVGSAEGSAA